MTPKYYEFIVFYGTSKIGTCTVVARNTNRAVAKLKQLVGDEDPARLQPTHAFFTEESWFAQFGILLIPGYIYHGGRKGWQQVEL